MHAPMHDLFDAAGADAGSATQFAEDAWLLRGFALDRAAALLEAIDAITAQAPFRHMETRRGLRMSVAMSNCGALGWVSDRRGYRYAARDPLDGQPWPPMPAVFARLAAQAARAAGFDGFKPDACLVNRYEPGTRLSLHQDRDERDFAAPIVSVSLGLPATFVFGGAARGDRVQRLSLRHGDVVAWGGASRLFHHGVLPLAEGSHPLLGARRINLTFRRAG
ncbi:DNA oxidative demethylase AlkB [Luteimonas mephitis]|uniref:DNA oxidative demethylase AlkB n=1 Tax=Luteimonas mephitis TaxID=83615 RepID=UPI00040B332B|nr:DNA oxidative demethylase AlkB [Luteimonas mephitis]